MFALTQTWYRRRSVMKFNPVQSILFIVAFFGNYEINAAENKFVRYGPPLKQDVERMMVPDTQLSACVELCALRPWCKVAGYHSKARICELYFETINIDESYCERDTCQSMMYLNREDFSGDNAIVCSKLCPKVGVLQKCDLEKNECLTDVCQPFSEKANGKVLGNTYHAGSVRRLLCNRGYSPHDPNKVESRCTNGHWTDMTACVRDCSPYQSPTNGDVSGTSTIDGSTRTLTCQSGYSPADPRNVTSTCMNGEWTAITKCLKDCSTYQSPTNGDVSGTSTIDGSTRNLTCQSGYSPADPRNVTSTCMNGEWTAITKCLKDCSTYQSPTNGDVSGTSTIDGSTRRLTCQSGYSPADPRNVTSTCMNGEWTAITKCLKYCSPYQSPTNGDVSGTSTIDGSTRNLTCLSGYSPADPRNVTSTCMNGEWTAITKCLKDCPESTDPPDGNFEGTNVYEGSNQTLRCRSGYAPLDSANITSQCKDGRWTNVTRCLKDWCVLKSGRFKESVYLFTDKEKDKLNEAEDVCSDCESQVVTLESEEEDKFVTAKFISLYENGSVGYWLGIKKTENGSLPNVSYNNFSPVEMNGGLNEMCFGVYEAANWTWVDLRCDMNYNIHVVCETVP